MRGERYQLGRATTTRHGLTRCRPFAHRMKLLGNGRLLRFGKEAAWPRPGRLKAILMGLAPSGLDSAIPGEKSLSWKAKQKSVSMISCTDLGESGIRSNMTTGKYVAYSWRFDWECRLPSVLSLIQLRSNRQMRLGLRSLVSHQSWTSAAHMGIFTYSASELLLPIFM